MVENELLFVVPAPPPAALGDDTLDEIIAKLFLLLKQPPLFLLVPWPPENSHCVTWRIWIHQ